MGEVTIGVEEEFLLGDAETGAPRPDAAMILDRARRGVEEGIDDELRTAMVETGTAVCLDAAGLRADLVRHRDAVRRAAAEAGAVVLATAAHPTAPSQATGFTDDERYQRMAERFGETARETLVCGCHVHVRVPDRSHGVAVIDRIGRWLAPLVAIAANSPLWQGRDTGFDSWRSQVWSRWPTAGPTSRFGDLAGYEARADALVAMGAAIDRGMLYYDARLSESFPTVEVRVADVCLDVDDAVLVALLARGLVETALGGADEEEPEVPVELLRAAGFVAARSGTRGELVDPRSLQPAAAPDVLTALVEHVAPALQAREETDLVHDGLARILARGNGAARQRAAWQRGGDQAVIDLVSLPAG